VLRRFGGQRTADPPAWGEILWCEEDCDSVEIFYGQEPILLGRWHVDAEHVEPVPEDEVPDEVWAALTKWKLSQ
jgi:hypothetical protein